MLEVLHIDAGYGDAPVLRDVSLRVDAEEILCVLGRNGAGKTTLMKAIMGLVPLSSGQIRLNGKDIGILPPHLVPGEGVGYVPQGRRLFGELSVAENLEIGLLNSKDRSRLGQQVFEVFPRLEERLSQRANTLSGGEQQMLATARAMCVGPRVMLFDEPTEGLQPSMIAAIRDVIRKMRANGVAVVLIEQRIDAVLDLADRVMFLENGHARETVSAAKLRADRRLLARYVGV